MNFYIGNLVMVKHAKFLVELSKNGVVTLGNAVILQPK